MTENTNLLKQILEEKKLSREKERVKLLNTTIDVVQRVAPQYSVSSVYNLFFIGQMELAKTPVLCF